DATSHWQQDGFDVRLAAHVATVRQHVFPPKLRIKNVVSSQKCAARQLRIDEIEARDVEILPEIDEHEIEWARQGSDDVARIARAQVHAGLETSLSKLRACVTLFIRAHIDADHTARALARGLSQENRRVAVRRAELEDDLRARSLDQEVQQVTGVRTD